ncbi:MAG: hypothetical protein KDC98_23665, partial [Planctomycetes bacterium]|nr:hypothetical protein [Planctomycetota bacterium]
AALRQAAIAGEVPTTVSTDETTRKAQMALNDAHVIHPFLGYVADGTPGRKALLEISPYGFLDSAPPLRKRSPDRFIVGIVGGSVALHHCLFAEAELIAALRRSPNLAGREIDIVHLALGGYRQPQQLFTVQLMLLLGGEFDCIVNIDGFNEVALVDTNMPAGVPAWYPGRWAQLADTVPTTAQQLRIGHIAVLHEQRREGAAGAETMWWSPLRQFVWLWRDRDLIARLAGLRDELAHGKSGPSFMVTGPGNQGRSQTEARADMVALWRRASRDLHDLCVRHDILYCHFLQPNQYVPDSKPIGAAEATIALAENNAWGKAVVETWPSLQREGDVLRKAGVAFADLSTIFRDHPEPLYTDPCCHFSKAGHVIMAEHVAAAIRSQLELATIEVRDLVIRPPRVELTSPLQPARIRVFAIDDAGQEHDISGAGFGVEAHAEPAGRIVVEADGAVRATRRGAATLHVARGAQTAAVEISADWPDLLTADDGRPGPDGEEPRLLLDGEAIAAGDMQLQARCSGLPAAFSRILFVSTSPLPDVALGSMKLGMQAIPLSPEGSSTVVPVKIGRPSSFPLFMRVYAFGSDSMDVVAASPTVIVTRG